MFENLCVHMHQISMSEKDDRGDPTSLANWNNWTANALYNSGSAQYNEVIIDSRVYTRNLPGSIAAVVFFDDIATSATQVNEEARLQATKAYVLMLDTYNLTEADLPMVKITRPDPLLAAEPQQKVTIEDVSTGTREYLREHTKQAFRRRRARKTDPKLRRLAH